jgi:hypothetical protein
MGSCGTREENAVVPVHAQGNSFPSSCPAFDSADFFGSLGDRSVSDCRDPVGRTGIFFFGGLSFLVSWDLEVGWLWCGIAKIRSLPLLRLESDGFGFGAS